MKELLPLVEQFPQAQQLLSKVRAFTIEIDAGTGVESRFDAVCESSDDADILGALLQADLRFQASQPGNSSQDVSAFLGQAKVWPLGDRLDVTLDLTDNQVVSLLQRGAFSIRK
jgi:hypothetical protein